MSNPLPPLFLPERFTGTVSPVTQQQVCTRNRTRSLETDLPAVRGHVMRTQRKRDPMTIYEVVQLLGEGSMGSVAKVKKRETAKGGSARKDFVEKSKLSCCFPLFTFFSLGGIPYKFETSRLTSSVTSVGSSFDDSEPQSRESSSSRISYGSKRDSYYALKTILLKRCSSSQLKLELMNEVEILKQLDHPNIVKAIETYDYNGRLFLVLELCSGGDLYTRDPYTEKQAAKIVGELLSAVSYLHNHDIVHRDLKYENIMFTNVSPEAEIKLIDFGLSQKFVKDEYLHDAVGTIYTMAPELLLGHYDAKADLWSVGVIAFMLLSSTMPFYSSKRKNLLNLIVAGHYSFSGNRWMMISQEAKYFVRALLNVNPKARPNADKALTFRWIKGDHVSDEKKSHTLSTSMDVFQSTIQAFGEYNMLKKLALLVMAYKSNSEDIAVLRDLFAKFDKDKNGEITLDEFKDAISKHYLYTDEEAENLFRGIDIDGNGTLRYCEFVAATLEALGNIDEESLAEAFDRIDSDDTGYITVSDLKSFLGDDVPTEYLDEIINEADCIEPDHKISYAEFVNMWNDNSDVKLNEAKVKVCAKRRSVIRKRSLSLSGIADDFEETENSPRKAKMLDRDGGSFFNIQKQFSMQNKMSSISITAL